ncbi:MAG TPA: MBOAT family protein [Planctomycetes bacterium]|nr:MBOAT family protein [Planctomycetota bacterium]
MSFDSLEYLALLTTVFFLFWRLPGRVRVPLLVLASFFFYASWNAPLLGLLLFSAGVDYSVARGISTAEDPKERKLWLALSLAANLGLLGFFKYADFIRGTLHALAPNAAWLAQPIGLTLPIGISFYTFQTMSYSIDVYRGRLKPTTSFEDFLLYVAFFPQLVAGPIERAGHLLPQIQACKDSKLNSELFYSGLLLVTWGLMKKIVFADNLAPLVDQVYASPTDHDGARLLLATWAFAFQIFFDFSAYSDIARGSAALLGIRLVRNFRLPYLAESASDLWRRWHISLSEWIRDYIYIPLGGARRGRRRTLINLALTMGLAGLWHGAAWHFVLWGLFHGLLLATYRVLAEPAGRCFAPFPSRLMRCLRIALMFQFTCVGWVLFRATSTKDALWILGELGRWLGSGAGGLVSGPQSTALLVLFAALFLIMFVEERFDLFRKSTSRPVLYGILLAGCLLLMALFSREQAQEFIYFQF